MSDKAESAAPRGPKDHQSSKRIPAHQIIKRPLRLMVGGSDRRDSETVIAGRLPWCPSIVSILDTADIFAFQRRQFCEICDNEIKCDNGVFG